MVPGLFAAFGFVLLVIFWFDKEFSLRAKLIATGIFVPISVLFLFAEILAIICLAPFALGLYFLMFPSGGFGR